MITCRGILSVVKLCWHINHLKGHQIMAVLYIPHGSCHSWHWRQRWLRARLRWMHKQLRVLLSYSRHLHSFTLMALWRIYSDELPRDPKPMFSRGTLLVYPISFLIATRVVNGTHT